MFEYIWILLPIGLLIGWFAAKKDIAKKQRFLHYLNLRYLLEDQKGKEYDELIYDLPLDNEEEILEFSLLLGDVFRRRGEIDKAINLHETLVRQAQNRALKTKAYYSLAEDFLSAGILNQAEEMFREVVHKEEGNRGETSLGRAAKLKLTHLYKQQRDWLQALAALETIEQKDKAILAEMAHFYCELATEEINNNSEGYLSLQNKNSSDEYLTDERIHLWLDKALEADPQCVRATLIKGHLALLEGALEKALQTLLYIEEQNSRLVPIITPMVYTLAFRLHKPEFFSQWLDKKLVSPSRHFSFVLWKTHLLVKEASFKSAIAYLEAVLRVEHNLKGLLLLNKLKFNADRKEESLLIYEKILHEAIDTYTNYQCDHCGFRSKTLQWNCPSCNQFNTNRPVSDIIALKS